MIIDHNHPEYKAIRDYANGFQGQYNGCWYYSHEIVDNIIPNVKTKRGWNTVGRELTGMCDGMIVFLHDNATPFNYGWLRKYNDLVLVCSSNYTRQAVCYSGHAVFLPMSIDTEYVKQFRVKKKTKDTCFVGNWWVREQMTNPSALVADKVDFLSNIPREKLLKEVAKYKRAYAIDRCALECLTLGLELLELPTRYHCENVGNVVDNRDAAKMLQQILNSIDGGDNE